MKRLVLFFMMVFYFGGSIVYAANESSLSYDEYVLQKGMMPIDLDQEMIYSEILIALENLEESVDLSKYGNFNDGRDMATIYFKVVEDHPEFFFLGNSVSWSGSSQGIILKFNYLYLPEEAELKIEKFEKQVAQIIEDLIKPSMSQLEMELAFHDYILLNTSYQLGTISNDSYTAYGVLMEGQGVCQGYAKAMQLLLNEVGIEAIYVSSPQMNHGWNIVTIEGETYHLDVTWNDPVPDVLGRVRYRYFNLSDEEMAKDHVWNTESYPDCASNQFNYLQTLNSYNVKRYKKYFYYSNGYLVKQKIDGSEKFMSDERISNLSLMGDVLSYKELITGNQIELNLKLDLNEDSWINHQDLDVLLPYYNEENRVYDLNEDGIIDIYDFVLLGKQV